MTKQWFSFTVRDLKVAKFALSSGFDFKVIAAFHAQQCVEKAIKGYLVCNNIRPPKTHSIKSLADLLILHESGLAKRLGKAEKLSKYAVEYRYPDAARKPLTLKQAQSAVKLAQKIYDILF